ncbi:hypothetical protein WR25_23121 [Diploscapter pachys]|uniref:RNA helicase n=1 Tax=Diploscapter pachys TaxID=2018661 RepID=A0A2A2LQH8_9BILA|nr:hypothetical protein WR25_23121 [Diploscapter pachys]
MKNHERRRIHMIVHRYPDLTSTSVGHEPNRCVVVRKRAAQQNPSIYSMQPADTEPIKLEPEMHETVRDFVLEFPIEQKSVDQYLIPQKVVKTVRTSTTRTETINIPPKGNPPMALGSMRQQLPVFNYKDKILEAIHTHRVVLVTGGTGCGKTTQVPQFLLDDAAEAQRPIKIICTQPRRLPAITIAERVAKERGEALPETVGYHIRLEQKTTPRCCLLYCTSGVLLRFLSQDDLLQEATHVILDEIHERETNTDYLLIALKQALKKRKDLKVILMSATMEGNLRMFMEYFGGDTPVKHISIESRLFHVDRLYLGEILALTHYMPPQNSFNSVFSCDLSEPFELTPHEQSMIPPPPPNTHFGLEYSRGFGNGYAGFPLTKPYEEMSQFEQEMHDEQRQLYSMRQFVLNALPLAPHFFDPCIVPMLNDSGICERERIFSEIYLKAGGLTFKEGVDYDLCLTIIRYCAGSHIPGAILVFLPGFEDITIVRDKIKNTCTEDDWNGFQPVVLMLHSQMNTFEQHGVFEKFYHNQRKIILSTNIAEASLTIEDVVFVVDCGKVKEKTYDHESRISQLKTTWIAKSNAEQRAGRAGRCSEGYCFRLYSRDDYDTLAECQTAEMRRSAIHDVCLNAKMFAPGTMTVKEFLSMAPEPPEQQAVENSMQFLEQLGALYSVASTSDSDIVPSMLKKGSFRSGLPALDAEPDLTDLGRVIAQLPLDPPLSRMLLFGIALRCLNPAVTLVAAMSNRDPFYITVTEERDAANRARDNYGRCDFSDHISLLRCFYEFENERTYRKQIDYCRRNFLNYSSMKMIHGIRRQLLLELRRAHIIKHQDGSTIDSVLSSYTYNKYSNAWPMVQAAIVAGSFPNVAWTKTNSKLKKIKTNAPEKFAILHPSSIVKRHVPSSNNRIKHINDFAEGREPTTEYLAYQELARLDNGGLTVRYVTLVPPCVLVLFAGALRMKQSTFETYNLVDACLGSDDENGEDQAEEDAQDMGFRTISYLYEVDSWFTVKSYWYRDMQRLLQLRFHVMSYFLRMLKSPPFHTDESHYANKLLETLNVLLSKDHSRMGFPPVAPLCQVNDPPVSQPQSQSSKSNLQNKTSSNHSNNNNQTKNWREREQKETSRQRRDRETERERERRTEVKNSGMKVKMEWYDENEMGTGQSSRAAETQHVAKQQPNEEDEEWELPSDNSKEPNFVYRADRKDAPNRANEDRGEHQRFNTFAPRRGLSSAPRRSTQFNGTSNDVRNHPGYNSQQQPHYSRSHEQTHSSRNGHNNEPHDRQGSRQGQGQSQGNGFGRAAHQYEEYNDEDYNGQAATQNSHNRTRPPNSRHNIYYKSGYTRSNHRPNH